MGAVMFLVTLFILQSASQLAINDSPNVEVVDDINQIERVYFELRDDVFSEAMRERSCRGRDVREETRRESQMSQKCL